MSGKKNSEVPTSYMKDNEMECGVALQVGCRKESKKKTEKVELNPKSESGVGVKKTGMPKSDSKVGVKEIKTPDLESGVAVEKL